MKIAVFAAAAIVGALLLTAGCNKPSERHGMGWLTNPNEVYVEGFVFDPDSLSIARGDTVTWVFWGDTLNTTTSGTGGVPDGRWASPPLDDLGHFKHTFDSTGVFPYFSSTHPDSAMVGWIIVRQCLNSPRFAHDSEKGATKRARRLRNPQASDT
jgi:plastocyanin